MQTVSVVLSDELLQAVEKERGPVKRSPYIVLLIEWALKQKKHPDYSE